MKQTHRIKQGETCAQVAAQYGIPEESVWNHSLNSQLKQKRKNPNVLFPGDLLNIPDITKKQEDAQTEQRHRFRRLGVPLKLRLKLLDASGEPLAGCECDVELGRQSLCLQTDREGRVEANLPLDVHEGKLRVQGGTMTLVVGYLDPVDEVSGWCARLNNLGYNAGSTEAANSQQRDYALEEFQCDYDLTVDTICGPKTQSKLVEIHGC